MLHPSDLLARVNLRSICALILLRSMHYSPRFLISVGCTYAALIPKVDLVTGFGSQVKWAFAETLLLQNCIRNDLRRSRNPKFSWGSMPPDPPRWHTCARKLHSNQHVTYLFNNLRTGLISMAFTLEPRLLSNESIGKIVKNILAQPQRRIEKLTMYITITHISCM